MKTSCCALLVFIAALLCAQPAAAQSDTTSAPAVEVHEGIFGMVSYFGGKLVDELATRLNLSEEDSTETLVPTQVVVKVGGVGFTRTEMRAKED